MGGDFNHDGKIDLAMTDNGLFGFDARVLIVLGNGNGTFGAPIVYTVGRGPLYLVTADFDRDGNLDLATINTGMDGPGNEGVTLLFGTGAGTFNRITTYYAPYSPDLLGATGITAGDVDRDGDIDIVTTGVSNDVAIYFNDGAGNFSFPYRLGAFAGTHWPLFADFTGDGVADLAVLSKRLPRGLYSGVGILRGVAALPLAATGAVSRKTHGSAGTFDIDLPLTGTPGVECRSGASGHTLVFAFSNNLVSGSATVTAGSASISGSPTFNGNTMTVNLSNVSNAQTLTVTLSNVTDTFGQVLPPLSVSMSILLGDSTGNNVVSATDVSQTKASAGATLTTANFRSDLNANGAINGTDVGIAKAAFKRLDRCQPAGNFLHFRKVNARIHVGSDIILGSSIRSNKVVTFAPLIPGRRSP